MDLTKCIIDVARGLLLPATAFLLIASNSKLWLWSLLPLVTFVSVVVTLYLVLASSLFGATYYSWSIRDVLDDFIAEHFVFSALVLVALAALTALVLSGVCTVIVMGLLTAPILSHLSLLVEQICDLESRSPVIPLTDNATSRAMTSADALLQQQQRSSTWQSVVRSLIIWYAEVRRLGLLGVAQCLSLVLFVTPLAPLAPIINIVAAGAFLVLNYTAYAMDRRFMPFETRRMLLLRNWPLATGFGCSLLVLCSIPFISLLTLPCFVVAGTLFAREILVQHGKVS
jgi:hypothetical protein